MIEDNFNILKDMDEKTMIRLITSLIKQYPNDYELGKTLRKIYKENEPHFKVLSEQQS
jgi:hypothetical protein